MRKIVRQQNYLKELITSQGNRFLSKRALKCLVRSALEPLLDTPEEGVVLYRIESKEGLQGLIKRLEFSEIKALNYSDNSGNLIEPVWANTEFLCTLTHRYVSILIWDCGTVDKDTVRYYSLYNSKLQREALDIIKRNSKIDITPYMEKYTPDRRDNVLLNASVRRLLDNMDEAAVDSVLGYAEKNAETLSDADYIEQKMRIVAHEIKNQLSICDLYNDIIRKYGEQNNIEGIFNAVQTINKSLKMANNILFSLKSQGANHLNPTLLKDVVNEAVELCKVYTENKNIELQVENNEDITILTDKDKLISIIINLVKNGAEAFPVEENSVDFNNNGKYIKIKTEKNEDFANILVSNNAPGIKDTEKIFNSGFTTKSTGQGLGLWICKRTTEELMGQLELSRSSEDYTEFAIHFGLM